MDIEKTKILLVDDNVVLSIILKHYLESENFLVKQANNGETAFEFFCKEFFDICLLDTMMPLMDGITLAKKIRIKNESIPIIFITANSKKEDIAEGFKIGADDYITKPYEMEELLARIYAVLRRSKKTPVLNDETTEFNIGKYVFNSERQTLTSKEYNFRLTIKEAQLLRLLALNKNELLERPYALKTIWHDDNHFAGRSMDVFITKLRKYLKNDPNVQIENVPKKGFKLLIKD